jgi:hypothetical protein
MMPVEFVGLITPEHFNFLSGGAGMLSAFIILTFWSKGL